MKPRDKSKRPGRITKGAPSGLVISLIFHGIIFFIAGIFIVFQVLPKEEPVFKAPPPVERPKMKLKKPRVKVKKSSAPKPSARIVAKVKTAKMPDIQIPDLLGTGEGLMGGTGVGGEFMDMPDLSSVSAFGSAVSTGNDLVGTFYDFKRTRKGYPHPIADAASTPPNTVDIIVHDFMKNGWKESSFARYYRSPKKLYASTICIGTVQSTLAPEAFGEFKTEGYAWAVVYRGQLVYYKDIKFRFRGVGDKFLAVRVGGKVVLFCAYNPEVRDYFSDIWHARSGEDRVYPMGEDRQGVGDWIELKAGVPLDMEVLLGDRQGGLVYQQLVVEVAGEKYPRNPYGGGPRLPVFKTDNLTRAQIDTLYQDTYAGDLCLTNGPVFRDYQVPPITYRLPVATNPPPESVKEASQVERVWTTASGSTLKAKFMASMGNYIIVEDDSKAQTKLPMDQLSDADRRFVQLATPPQFRIEFSKRSNQEELTTLGPYDYNRPLSIADYTFGVKIKKYSPGEYDHKLTMQYYAIGGEVNGNNYVLLDKGKDTFTPSRENSYAHEFYGKPVRLMKYANRATAPMRGIKYDGYLVVVTDEKGWLVQYRTSNKFLFRHLDRLEALPVDAHFDKNCIRTYPPRLIDADRGPGASL